MRYRPFLNLYTHFETKRLANDLKELFERLISLTHSLTCTWLLFPLLYLTYSNSTINGCTDESIVIFAFSLKWHVISFICKFDWYDFNLCRLLIHLISLDHIDVRDQFSLGPKVSCPKIVSSACPKIKWFCPNITCISARKLPFWKILGGGGGLQPPPPRTPMRWMIPCVGLNYTLNVKEWKITRNFERLWFNSNRV